MSKTLPPLLPINTNFTDRCGQPLAGGKVFIYEQHSLVPKDTWSDVNGQFKNTHPIILDEAGNAGIYYEGLARVVVYDNRGTKIHDVDNHGFPTTSSVDKSLPKASASGMPLGSIYWWNGKELPLGAVAANGQLVRREDYPYLWADMEAGKYHIVTDERWLESPRYRGLYSLGDGVGTFRVPDLNGAMQDSIKSPVLRGGQSTSIVPTIQADTVREISGNIGFNANLADDDQGDVTYQIANFDASLTVPTASALGSYVIQLSNGYDPKGIVTSINGLFGDVEIPKITEMLSTREELDDEFGENDTTPIIPPTSPHLTLNIRTVGSNVTASGTTEANAAIKVTVGNNVVNTTASASGAWSVDLVVMSEGPHTAVVTATDRAGNTTAQSINFIVNITTGISVTITGVTTLNNNEFVISGTGEVGSVVDVDVGSQSLSVLVGQDGVWSTVVSGLVAASYTAIATHTNSIGITTTATFDFNVDADADVDVDATRGLFDVSKIADGYTISPSTALISKVADTNNKIALIPITVGDVYIYSEHTMSLPSNFAAQVFDDIALLGQQSPTGRIIPSAVQTGHANWYKFTLSDPSIAALSITLQIASNNDFNLANSLRVFKDSLPVDAVPSLSINSIPAISAATPFVLSGTSKMLDYEVVIIVKDDTNTTKVSARTTVGESGNWSYSVAGLVSGTYTIDLSINIGSGKALIRKNLVVE